MASLRINGSVLIVKYLYDNNGSPYYQRRVPDDLRNRFRKSKISIALDPANGIPAMQVQRLAKKHDLLFKALRNNPDQPLADEKLAALTLLDNFGLKPGDARERLDPRFDKAAEFDDQPHLSGFFDYLIELQREGRLTSSEKLALKAIQGPLPVSLSEMPEIYFEHHRRGSEPLWRKKQLQYWSKLVAFLGDVPAESVDRNKARAYRSHRESLGLKSQSVQKDLNIIKAIFGVCIRELPLSMDNPFDRLNSTGAGIDAEQRVPFTTEELRLVIDSACARSDEIRRIALTCALTGARLAEVVGLRKSDLKISGELPYFSLVNYGARRLKTRNSIRDVPMVPLLVNELQKQQKDSGGSEALFPRYNDMKLAPKASGASAAVNKWLRDELHIEKTAHSFRHSMADLLREAGVTEDLREELLGHGKQKASDNYGLGRSLDKKMNAMKAAYRLMKAS